MRDENPKESLTFSLQGEETLNGLWRKKRKRAKKRKTKRKRMKKKNQRKKMKKYKNT